jgi:uncharacterized protein (DUF4415 family)
MSKRNSSGSGKVSDRTSPFEADLDDEMIEFDDDFFQNARVVIGGKVIREASGTLTHRGRPPLPEGTRKELVSVRLSPDILNWLRSTGPGWQSRLEDMLRERMEATLAAKD